jgi:uncharacterized membrane protein YqjE
MFAQWLAPQIEQALSLMRRAVALGAGMAADRIELARLEWQDQKERLARLAVLAVCALVLGALAVAFVGLFVIVAAWDTPWRLWAAGGVALVLMLGALGLVLSLKREWARGDEAFALLRAELEADLRALRGEP